MKKKLAIIIPSLNGGGAERVILNIINNIDKLKFDVRLILMKKEGVYLEMLPDNLEVIDLQCIHARYSFLKLIKSINDYKPDTILSTLDYVNILLLLIRPFLKGRPKIIIREANTPSKSLERFSNNKKKLLSFLYKRIYSTSDLIVAQCKEMKQDIIDTYNIKEEKIKYIYNPIDTEKIFKKYKKNNPYNKNEINLVAVGRLSYQKGFDNLIEAFQIVTQRVNNIKLFIVGDGELKEKLIELTIELGINEKVVFCGFKENPYPYLYYADIYILSSRWEGFPNSLLEALACKTKVISTNCKSGPKEIIGDNKYGNLVPVDDSKLLADIIIRTLTEENKSGDRYKIFEIDNIIKQYEKILE